MSTRTGDSFCPYVGLQPYTEGHRAYFFGRERDQRVIASNMFAAPLTILYGASGVGKSSALMAGVVPDLREKPRTAVVLFREWQRADFASAFKSACADAVERAQQKPVTIDTDLPLDDWLAEAASAFGGSLLVLFDQFEEYFLYHPETHGGDAFEAAFARAVNREDIDIGFLLSLREDTLSRLDRFRARIPNLLGNTLRLQHLDLAAAAEAIRKPLDVYNREAIGAPVAIEDALVEAVLTQVQTGKVALTQSAGAGQAEGRDGKAQIEAPFLQLVMTRVWDEEVKAGSPVLRMGTLQRLGGAERLVRTHLDQTMGKLRRRERAVAASLFHFLVTPTGTKIAHTAHDLASYAEKPERTVEPVLDRLSSPGVRILRCLAPEPGQVSRYEVFHDVLAAAIIDWHRRYTQRKRLWRRVRRMGRWAAMALTALLAVAFTSIYFFTEKEERRTHLLAMQKEEDRGVPYFKAILRGSINNLADAAFSPDGRFIVTVGEATSATITDRMFFTDVVRWDTTNWEGSGVGLFNGHQSQTWVTDIAFSPDGRSFGTASTDRTVQVRETVSGGRVAVLKGHEDIVWSVAFSPDGLRVVSASADKTARIWDARSGKSVADLRGHTDAVVEAAFSPDGRRVVTVSMDKTARLWDAHTGQSLGELQHEGGVRHGLFSPNGTRVLTASYDHTARLWDAATGAPLWARPHLSGPDTARFSPDGRHLVTTDGLVARVWETESDTGIAVLHGHTGSLTDARFSPDGKWVVTASYDNTARVWDAATGESIAELRGHFSDVTLAAFSPDGKWILTAGADSTARVWEVKPAKTLGEFGGHGDLLAVSVGTGSKTQRAMTAGEDKSAQVWDVTTGKLLLKLVGHGDTVGHGEFSNDGTRLLTASGSSVCLWNSESGRRVAELRHANEAMGSFSRDGNWVITASDKRTAHVWDARSGARVAKILHSDGFTWFDLSPDGKRFVTTSGASVRVWDVGTSRLVTKMAGEQRLFTRAQFSPDGKHIVGIGAGFTAQAWDAGSGRRMAEIDGHANLIFGVEFSPDGTRVVTASKDKTARIWEVGSGKLLVELAGHWDTVVNATFSPNGKLVVTASADGTGRIWDAATGERVAELVGHQGALEGASFSADGSRVITWDRRTVRVWQASAK